MTCEVYIDVVFFVNLAMDFAVLAVLNRMLGTRAGALRLAAGAAVGALWACAVTLAPGLPLWARAFGTYVAAAGLMAAAAFRPRSLKSLARAVLGLYGSAAVLGGIMTALYQHTRAGYYLELLLRGERAGGLPVFLWLLVAAGSAAGGYGLMGLWGEWLKGRIYGRRYCFVTLCCQGNQIRVRALLDTGNCLREPVSGRPVHVATAKVMARLCPKVEGVIYIPFQAVGTEQGLLPALFLDWMEVELDRDICRLKRPLVAVAREGLSPGDSYEMLLQQEQLEEFRGEGTKRAKPLGRLGGRRRAGGCENQA